MLLLGGTQNAQWQEVHSECESSKNVGGRDSGVCFWKQHLESMLDLQTILDDITSNSRIAKLWVYYFI